MESGNSFGSSPVSGTRLVLIALALAVVAVIANSVYLQRVRDAAKRDSFPVYVITRPLKAGTTLDARDIKEVLVPRDFEKSFEVLGYVDSRAKDQRLSESWQLQRSTEANQILTHDLFYAGTGVGVDQKITPGYRLVSIPVNARTAPAILQPKMHVDIEAPFHVPGGSDRVLPVLENVLVVAVDAYTGSEDSGKPVRAGGFNTIQVEVPATIDSTLATIKLAAAGPFELFIRKPSDDKPLKIPGGGVNPRVLEILKMAPQVRPITVPDASPDMP